jgi:signal transduction histidine kinase
MVVTSLKDYQGTKFVHNDDSLVFVDQCGIIQYSNSNINKIFGFNQNVLYKKNVSILFPKSFSKNIYTYIYRCINDEKLNLVDGFITLKDTNKVLPIRISFKKYNFIGIKGVLLRIKKRNQEDNLSNNELIKIFKEHANFVSKTSHELRNPLTTILNATTILEKLKNNGEYENMQTKNINRIKKSIDQLTKILDDFLMINKIEATDKTSTFDTDILSFSKEIIENVKGNNLKNIYISYKHCGTTNIRINKEMLNSVFHNLLSNAIKYSPKRSLIQFKTKVEENKLIISCKDNGIGIPKEEHKNLFIRYFRANNTTNIQGTGLGLSIIKEYIDKVGGTIYFESKLNKGTTFVVVIPLNYNSLSEKIS